MAKRNIMPYLRKTLYVLAIFLLIAMIFYFKIKQGEQSCREIKINIVVPLDKQLLTEEMVQDKILKWYPGGLVGLPMSDIDIAALEDSIQTLAPVNNVEVSYQLNGDLQIDIDQKIPIVRLYKGAGPGAYLDRAMSVIPSKGLEPARVPVASGNISGDMINKVYTLSTYVQENTFAEALTEQIFVTDEGVLILIPKMGSHRVIIGDPVDLEDKFKRLELFYKHGLSKLGWDRYKTINLSFKGQIVCN